MSAQNTNKRPKLSLSNAFGAAPTKQEEVASHATVSVSDNKTTVSILPPCAAKFGLFVPAAVLKVHSEKGSAVTIASPKKPGFTFVSPTIDGTQVAGYAYVGYTIVAGGDNAPPTGSFGSTRGTDSAYKLMNGKVFPSASIKAPPPTLDSETTVPMSKLGGTWTLEVPTIMHASNTCALFNLPSFQDAVAQAASRIEIGTNAVHLVAADKKLALEPAVVSGQLTYLPYLSCFVVLFNPPDDLKHGAKVMDVISNDKRPYDIVLQHPAKVNNTVSVQVWPSVLEWAGVNAQQLRYAPLIAYIDATLDPYRQKTILTVVAVAAPPPDPSQYIMFSKSPTIKAHFNDIGFKADEAKSGNTQFDQLLMNEGRAAPLKKCRVGVLNSLLLDKCAVMRLLKQHAESLVRENPTEDTKGLHALVEAATEEATIGALEAIDQLPSSIGDVENMMTQLRASADDDDVAEDEHTGATIAATFLHALLSGGRDAVESLGPMVYGWKTEGDGLQDKDAQDDDDEDDDEELAGNL